MKKIAVASLAAVGIVACVFAGVDASRQQGTSPVDALRGVIPQSIDSANAAQKAPRTGAGVSNKRQGPRNLTTGFGDFYFTSPDGSLRRDLLDTAKKLNAGAVRLYARWRSIAPSPKPDGFVATDPNSPGYEWGPLDDAVDDAKARGMRPIFLVNIAPDWAEGKNRPSLAVAPAGTWKPNPSDVADFGAAIAKRYKGQVRDYVLWNEPNLTLWLNPQAGAPGRYRSMLNAFYNAVHSVDGLNRVITAGTAPYGGGRSEAGVNTRPLKFWRKIMCVKDNQKLSSTKCQTKAKFDVLAHHPISTRGGPRASAFHDDDISTPDFKNLVRVLRAAEKAGNVKPGGRRPAWATELWWETNPPDPLPGNSGLGRQARWYQEALYVLWKQGASLVTFYQVRDDVYDGNPGLSSWESGVEFANGSPKPSGRAVRFPFVADRKSKRKVYLWGKAPSSGKLKVMNGKRRVAKLNVKAGKIFTKTVRLKGKRKLRAEVGNIKSLTWNLK